MNLDMIFKLLYLELRDTSNLLLLDLANIYKSYTLNLVFLNLVFLNLVFLTTIL